MCTSGAGARSVCGGDSGGPLVFGGQLLNISVDVFVKKMKVLAIIYPACPTFGRYINNIFYKQMLR